VTLNKDKVEAAYRRGDLFEKRRKMMEHNFLLANLPGRRYHQSCKQVSVLLI
jgi:hypothetical protein